MTDDEAELVADALEVPPASLRLLSREPLGGGSVTGFAVRETETIAYLDSSRQSVAAETGFAREDGVRIWLHPADPHLPALTPVAYHGGAGALLERLGLGPLRSIEMIAYRPGRRAILRVDTGGETEAPVWVKVVRPSRVTRIVDAHRALIGAGLPVPDVLGWSPDGLLVLSHAAGDPATEVEWDAEVLLDAVDDLRARLAAAPLDQPARTSLARRLEWYVTRLRAALPADGRVDEVAREAERMLEGASPESVTVHGDLHLGQLFLSGAEHRVTGLVDVDTAGRGDAADDAAAFLAHAVTSAIGTEPSPAAARVWALAVAGAQRWGDDRVTALTQVHLLGHALGAAERAEGDPAVADRLLGIAVRLRPHMRKSDLIEVFGRAYPRSES